MATGRSKSKRSWQASRRLAAMTAAESTATSVLRRKLPLVALQRPARS